MKAATMQPYVKQLDENGVVTNPVTTHEWDGNNRRQRRSKQPRNFNNSKGVQLNVFPKFKYKKVLQRMPDRTIVHYV